MYHSISVIPVVKNADGSNAKYEDDFVTNYNGTKLTEDQYDNLVKWLLYS